MSRRNGLDFAWDGQCGLDEGKGMGESSVVDPDDIDIERNWSIVQLYESEVARSGDYVDRNVCIVDSRRRYVYGTVNVTYDITHSNFQLATLALLIDISLSHMTMYLQTYDRNSRVRLEEF